MYQRLIEMSTSVSIPSSHLKYLIPGYKLRLEEIERSIELLEQERKEIKRVISTVNEDDTSNEKQISSNIGIEINEYNENLSWFAKAKFILKKAGKPLTTSQIVDEIMSYEPNMNNRTLAVRNISSILGVKSSEGKEIERFKIEGKDQKFAIK